MWRDRSAPRADTDTNETQALSLVDSVACSTRIADYLTAIEIEELRAELATAHAHYSRLLQQPVWLRGGAEFRCADITRWRQRLLAGLVPDIRRRSLLQTSQPKGDWVDAELPLLSELRWRYRMAWETELAKRMAAQASQPIDDAELSTEAEVPSPDVQAHKYKLPVHRHRLHAPTRYSGFTHQRFLQAPSPPRVTVNDRVLCWVIRARSSANASPSLRPSTIFSCQRSELPEQLCQASRTAVVPRQLTAGKAPPMNVHPRARALAGYRQASRQVAGSYRRSSVQFECCMPKETIRFNLQRLASRSAKSVLAPSAPLHISPCAIDFGAEKLGVALDRVRVALGPSAQSFNCFGQLGVPNTRASTAGQRTMAAAIPPVM